MVVLLQSTFRLWGANFNFFSECSFRKRYLGSNFAALVLLLCRFFKSILMRSSFVALPISLFWNVALIIVPLEGENQRERRGL